MTDPLERVTTYTLDAADRLTALALPGTRTVRFAHDRDGLLTSLTPPGRPAHTFGYTATPDDPACGAAGSMSRWSPLCATVELFLAEDLPTPARS